MANPENGPSRGSSVDISRADSIELLLHGSCPRCHHWFNRHPIRVLRHTSRAQIICCTNCRERFFGLGGNSTHNSFNSQLTIPQSPGRESSTRRPPGQRSARLATPLEAVNEVASLGIIRTGPLGGARTKSSSPGSQNPLHQARHATSDPTASYNVEGGGAGVQADERRPSPLRPVVRAARERMKRTVNRIRYRYAIPSSTPVEGREPEDHRPSDLGSVHPKASQQESRSAERPIELSNNQDQHPQESDGAQDTEDAAAGTCACGIDCGCATSSIRVGNRSLASLIQARDYVSGSPVIPAIDGHAQEANVSRQRGARASLILACAGGWALSSHEGRSTDSHRSSMIEGSGSSSEAQGQVGDHRCNHSCQVCCRRLQDVFQALGV